MHLTLRTDALPAESARHQGPQRYGLLMLGIAKTVGDHGGFHEEISRIAAMNEGPLAVVVARGAAQCTNPRRETSNSGSSQGQQGLARRGQSGVSLTRPGDRMVTALCT